MKKAILQVADTGPLESLVSMLRSAGYECRLPSNSLKSVLRRIGCDTVLDVDNLVRGWGYSRPMDLPEARLSDMDSADLYVDVKGHRNGPLVERHWPSLKGKVLWYRINGGKPEHVINAGGDQGDEVNPPCPVLTPNQWYRATMLLEDGIDGPRTVLPANSGRAYAMWPPFERFGDYFSQNGRAGTSRPVCLIHNVNGWGYRDLVQPLRERFGLMVMGNGSPDGLVPHGRVPQILASSIAMVHLKSNDAPGYALYEALAAGCPVIVSRRLIWRCRMQELFEPGVTCLTFDRETHDPLSPGDVEECTREIGGHLEALQDRQCNHDLGMAGRNRLIEIMWAEGRTSDVSSFREFMARCFPGS